MDWNAIGTAALLGAIGGGLGAVLGGLVATLLPEKARGIAVGVGAAIGLAISQTAGPALFPDLSSRSWYDRSVTAEQFDREIERSTDPMSEIIRIVRDNDADLYASLRDKIIAMVRAGRTKTEVINAVREQFAGQVAARVPKLNDRELEQALDIFVLQLTHYNNVAPKVCVDLLLQRPAGDIRQYMSDELKRSEIRLNRIVFSSKLEGGPTLSEEEVQAALRPIQASIIDLHGGEGSRVMIGVVRGIDDRKVCSVYLTFLNGIRDLPMPRRARLWRTLSKAGGGG